MPLTGAVFVLTFHLSHLAISFCCSFIAGVGLAGPPPPPPQQPAPISLQSTMLKINIFYISWVARWTLKVKFGLDWTKAFTGVFEESHSGNIWTFYGHFSCFMDPHIYRMRWAKIVKLKNLWSLISVVVGLEGAVFGQWEILALFVSQLCQIGLYTFEV